MSSHSEESATVSQQYIDQKLKSEMEAMHKRVYGDSVQEPFSNQLSDAETERLALLSEELGEAVQAIGKILRHGYTSVNPDKPEDGNNRDRLTVELGDVLASIKLLTAAGDIRQETLDVAIACKLHKVARYMHHQPQ